MGWVIPNLVYVGSAKLKLEQESSLPWSHVTLPCSPSGHGRPCPAHLSKPASPSSGLCLNYRYTIIPGEGAPSASGWSWSLTPWWSFPLSTLSSFKLFLDFSVKP